VAGKHRAGCDAQCRGARSQATRSSPQGGSVGFDAGKMVNQLPLWSSVSPDSGFVPA
jgi:hypothetical protein